MSGAGEPRLARWLVAVLTPAEDRAYLLGDLRDGWRGRRSRSGPGAAWRWYWWQALRVIPARLSSGGGAAEPGDPRWRSGGVGPALRLALRSFGRRPLYAAGVALTLGLGLGAASAVGAVAWGIWFRPLPYPDAERVVRLYEVNLRADGEGETGPVVTAMAPPSRWNGVSPALLEDLRAASFATIDGVASVSLATFDWTNAGAVLRIPAQMVSPEIFAVLGVRPLHGRELARTTGDREVVLTEAFWQRAFGRAPDVLGRSLVLDGNSYAIVGVVPSSSGYPEEADVWVPLAFEESALREGMRGARYLDAVARVRPGHTVAAAAAEVDAFVRALAGPHPIYRGWGGHVVPVRETLVRPYRGVLAMLLGAGTLFVMLALVNVAGLVAANRVQSRQARMIRLALGASHRRILHEGLIESTLLGLFGALLAAAGATWVLAPIKRLMPPDVPRLSEIMLSGGMLFVIVLSGVLMGLLVGVLGHAMSGVRDQPSIGRNRDAGQPGVRGRRALLITQVALTTWLLLGGVALVRYISSLRAVDIGFRASDVLTAPVTLSAQRQGASAERSYVFWDDLLHRLESRGATAAVATNPPISGSTMRFGYAIRGDASEYWAQYHTVSPAYFDVLGLTMAAGRAFTPGDAAGAAPVVIINDVVARAHFANEDPVGRTIRVVDTDRTIVGVARATRHFGPDSEAPAELYVPLAQDPWPFAHVLIRGGPAVAPGLLADVVAEIDGTVAAPPLAPFDQYVSTWFAPLRLQLVIIGVFATVGVILAALGLYALVAYLVSNRVREIGIRLALGERSPVLFRRILGDGLAMSVAGVVIGLGAGAATRGVIGRLVTGVDPADPVVVIVVMLIVPCIAIAASVLPARRAIGVDPIVTLRAD
jgi:putative ABC transport system permease protein